MILRKYESSDYKHLYTWWEQHNWPSIPPNCLPKTGYIVEDVCAGFLYKTDSQITWLEFIVSNKESEKEVRDLALDLLIDKLISEASDSSLIFTSVEHPKLIERYKKHGFEISDRNMTNMIKRVQ